MEGLNAGTVYAGRPPGNEPELMPWDAVLNQDVDCAVGRNVAFCSMMKSTDFSAVPVYAPVPEGERLTSPELVISSNGVKVPFDSVNTTGTSLQASMSRVRSMISVLGPHRAATGEKKACRGRVSYKFITPTHFSSDCTLGLARRIIP